MNFDPIAAQDKLNKEKESDITNRSTTSFLPVPKDRSQLLFTFSKSNNEIANMRKSNPRLLVKL